MIPDLDVFFCILFKEFLMMTTFQTHPWIFLDKFTGERMVVNHEEVYWPKPWYLKIDPKQRTIKRALVKIHFPMRSLKVNALWNIVRRLKSSAAIDELIVPVVLQKELRTLYEGYQRHLESRTVLNEERENDTEEENGRRREEDDDDSDS